MSFEFDGDTAGKIFKALEELGDDAQKGSVYVSEYTAMPFYDQGVINLLSGAHADITTKVTDQMDTLNKYFRTTISDNLADTFRLYKKDDEENGNKLRELEDYFSADSEMMSERREAEEEDPATGTSSDPFRANHNPRSSFEDVELTGSDSFREPMDPPGVLDLFSISYAIQSICELCGWYPTESLGKKLAGDWDKIAKCGKAFRNLADGVDKMAYNLGDHVDQLEQGWSGNAYAACNVALHRGANEIKDGTADVLRKLADKYEEAAQKTYDTHKELEPLVRSITDMASGFGLAKAAGQGIKNGIELFTEKTNDIMGLISLLQNTINTISADLESIGAEFEKPKSPDSVPPVLKKYDEL
ncbi:hypothetical protein SAMN04487904_10288 [Actinopolyspora lacussalsi subsp. righensis]|uniref:Proteins of 100 residues with WXG n=1 Tax=Actinopolyspora righensis TaxID=995060 RepID=A0A1I6Y0K1_9ACTN|nr:WXG100 family type VII secretion target [Actinopolyspora righensis]SFT43883.1 hypothetical protein SAMN04487904_10288 [Actinopolyspora righensis]